MGRRSRTKGLKFQAKVARELREIVGEHGANTQSQAGMGGAGGADVDCPPFGLECKHVKKLTDGLTKTLERLSVETERCRLPRIPILWWRFDDGTSRAIHFKERVFIRQDDLDIIHGSLYDHLNESLDGDVEAIEKFKFYTSCVHYKISGRVHLQKSLNKAMEHYLATVDDRADDDHHSDLIVLWEYGKGADMKWGKRAIMEASTFKWLVTGLVRTGAIDLLKRRVREREEA